VSGAGTAWRWTLRGAVLLGLGALAMAWSDRGSERLSATVIVPAAVQQHFTGAEGPGAGDASRPIYPMSVIPGGALSVAELREYLKTDAVARQSFEAHARRAGDPKLLDHLVVRRVEKPARMYSQLRKGTKLCWTSRPVTVEAGESGFYSERSDDLVARARCGNVMVMTVPAGEMRVAPPPSQPIGYTPPSVQVIPESGTRPPAETPPAVMVAGERGVMLPMVVPPTVPQIPPIPTIPAPTIITPPAAAAAPPPVVIPPVSPPTQVIPPPQILKGGGDGIPWWGLLGGGLLGGAAGRASINVNQKQQQKQHQHQHQHNHNHNNDDDTEPVPEPGTMLLLTVGLGAAGGYVARRRRQA
jgi:hypothetical protein